MIAPRAHYVERGLEVKSLLKQRFNHNPMSLRRYVHPGINHKIQ